MPGPDPSDVADAAREVGDSRPVRYGARLGYAASGVLHVLVGWIALRLAWGAGSGTADQSGAFTTLAEQPGGALMLWVAAAGFALLAVWQLTEAVGGSPGRGAADRAKATGKLVMYAALAWTAYRFASGGHASSRTQTRDATASLMDHTGGQLLVALVGVAIVAVGGYHVHKGWTRGFLRDLREHPGAWAVWSGRAGYVAKGIALVVMGVLFVVGAVRGSTSETTGLDGALRALSDRPLGTALLTVVAVGIMAYGGYSFARARYARV